MRAGIKLDNVSYSFMFGSFYSFHLLYAECFVVVVVVYLCAFLTNLVYHRG